MSSQWWFAKETMVDNRSSLVSTTIAGSADYTFNNAQKMTISVENAFTQGYPKLCESPSADNTRSWPNIFGPVV